MGRLIMSCERFCKGAINTKHGMKATIFGLTNDDMKNPIFQNMTFSHGKFDCPFMCKLNPTDEQAARSLKENGAKLVSFCHNNKYRFVYDRECNPKPRKK